MTKLNGILTILLIASLLVPGICFAAGFVASTGFAGIFLKFIAGIAFITLATNVVALFAYKNRG